MKVPMKKRKFTSDYGKYVVQWNYALPFFLNQRGILVHRVQSAMTHTRNGNMRHHSVRYFCGNGCCTDGMDGFYADPPADRLLCHTCEAKAKYLGKKTADELAGRHVHVGRLRAERTCCNEDREAN